MSFPGWMMFAGTEILNATRTVAYAASLLPTMNMKDCYDCPNLGISLEDPEYINPITDGAPWYDPDQPETAGFLGLYPLSVRGLDDATTTATVGESIGNGGFVSTPRQATREFTVNGLLVGVSHAAASAGLVWLKSVLQGTECGDTCEGDSACFLAHCPDAREDMTNAQVDARFNDAVRHLRNVTLVEGPTVTDEQSLSCGGYYIRVEFTMVAASPYIYTEPQVIATQSGNDLVAHKPGADIFVTPTIGTGGAVGFTKRRILPLADPDCPTVPTAPQPPALPSACGITPGLLYSYAVYIPETSVQSWREGIIQLELHSGAKPIRYTRIRMMPRPLPSQTPQELDPASGCGSFLVNYIPANTKVTIDGMTERIVYNVANGPAQAGEHLVSGVDTEMFEWPTLTCGIGYYVLIDVDSASRLSRVSLSTANRE